jgi:hypothetical protein
MSDKYILVKNPTVGEKYYIIDTEKDDDNDVVSYNEGILKSTTHNDNGFNRVSTQYYINEKFIGNDLNSIKLYKLNNSYTSPSSCEEKFAECKKNINNNLQSSKKSSILSRFFKSGGKMRSRKEKSKRRRTLKKHKKTKSKR